MSFFTPHRDFILWLKQFAANRLVFDVGCGEGYLLLRAVKAGIRMVGVDPHSTVKRALTPVTHITQYGEHCKLMHRAQNAVVLFCRPCHDGFVARTLRKLHPTTEALYISIPKNRLIDLPCFMISRMNVPGCNEEVVYRVMRPYPVPDAALAAAEAEIEMTQLLLEERLRDL